MNKKNSNDKSSEKISDQQPLTGVDHRSGTDHFSETNNNTPLTRISSTSHSQTSHSPSAYLRTTLTQNSVIHAMIHWKI